MALPENRDSLIPVGYKEYACWLDMAKAAKKDHLAERLSGEEFLRKIDVNGDLESYDVEKVTLPEPNRTPWRKDIKRNIDFVPESKFVGMDFYNLRKEGSKWTLITAEQQKFRTQGGHQGLVERYDSETRIDPAENAGKLDQLFSETDDPVINTLSWFLSTAAYLSLGGKLPQEENEDGP